MTHSTRHRVLNAVLAPLVAAGAGLVVALAASAPAHAAQILPTLTGNITVGQNVDGRVEVFAGATDGVLYEHVESTPGAHFAGWDSLGAGYSRPTVAANTDGRLELYASGPDRAVYHRWQLSPGGAWSDWYDEGLRSGLRPALIQDGAGRLVVFAFDGDTGTIWTKQESGPSAGPWTPWVDLGGGTFLGTTPAVGRDTDGRLELFTVGQDHAIWHNVQLSSGGAWSGWNRIGGDFNYPTPSIAVNTDGRLELFALGNDGATYQRWQNSPSGDWSGWYSQGGSTISLVASVQAANADGRLQVFVTGTDFGVWSRAESGPSSGPWTQWTALGGSFGAQGTGDWSGPEVIRNADGTLQLFEVGHSLLYTSRQATPNGAWSRWQQS